MAYLSLSTANLPDPAIDPAQGSSPEDYFNTVLWSGNSTSGTEINGLEFQPDFVWLKSRNTTWNHTLQDAVRGVSNYLISNLNAAEASSSPRLTSFDSDGFTLTDNGNSNNSGDTYVAWNWKANGSGVSNTDGSITSTVSANTESGFSICTYTGNNTNGATFGHGLNSAPEMVIFKRRDSSSSWAVGHTDLGWNGILILNNTNTFNTGYNIFNSVAPSSSVVTLGNTGDANEGTIVAYCFHSVEGFSKFGSYTGNGNADGSFVYTGFRPAFLIIKATGLNEGWIMYDTKRNSYNLSSTVITAEEASGDATNVVYGIDILSNGFKCRYNWNGVNGSGQNYIYMAFAENPFKYSNAR